jgi:hypothetical protein
MRGFCQKNSYTLEIPFLLLGITEYRFLVSYLHWLRDVACVWLVASNFKASKAAISKLLAKSFLFELAFRHPNVFHTKRTQTEIKLPAHM